MPSHFDRFRLLSNGGRIRNESNKFMTFRRYESEEPTIVGPGEEKQLPDWPDIIIDVQQPD